MFTYESGLSHFYEYQAKDETQLRDGERIIGKIRENRKKKTR